MNTTTAGDQFNPVVAMLPSGGHVVVWTTQGTTPGTPVVAAQVYDVNRAKSGPEVTLASGCSAGQIAALADGTWIVSLTSTGSDPQTHLPTSAVYYARYDAAGHPLGAPVLVDGNGDLDHWLSGGAVFAMLGGGFALIETNMSRPIPYSTVTYSIRVFDGSGALVDSIAAGENVAGSSIRGMTSGGYVVANQAQTGPGPSRISWQTLDAQGNRIDGAQFQSIYNQSDYYWPSAVALADGGAVVIWGADFAATARTSAWQAQLIDPTGHAAGGPIDWSFCGNGSPRSSQLQLSPLPHGGFLASCAVDAAVVGSYALYAQAFDDSAQPVGPVRHLATLSGPHGYDWPVYSITGTADGGFLLDWQAAGDGQDIFEQKFDMVP